MKQSGGVRETQTRLILTEQLGQASPDLLREMITTFGQALMGAEADAVCGAE